MKTKLGDSIRKDFTCESIVNDFLLLEKIVKDSDDEKFCTFFLTQQEILQEKEAIIQELKLDAVFKLLTKLEADIRQDYNETIRLKKRDALSKEYLLLCENFLKRIKEYDKHFKSACKRVRLEDILDTIKCYFKNKDKNLAKDCSLLKTYFKNIRDWYAHGRYFKLSSPIYIPEPKEIKTIYDEFDANIFCRKK
jgi:hypothetical protein